MSTQVRLMSMPTETSFAPLGVLGYCLTRTDFFTPVWQELHLPLKTVVHRPEAKLLDLLVSILAGCRAVSQVNTRLCPDVALARAWGRSRFAEQATLARTLDAFEGEQVAQLRRGSDRLFRRESLTLRHNFAQDWLWVDIDLTPLPISKRAEGSTKGKLGEKTVMVANSPACKPRSITKRCSRGSILANKKVARPTNPYSKIWRHSFNLLRRRNNAPSCVRMPALAATPISTML